MALYGSWSKAGMKHDINLEQEWYEQLAQDYPNQTPQWLHIAAISKFYLLKSNGN